MTIHAIAFSESQAIVVAESTAVCVWYDYDTLSKCHTGPPEEFKHAFQHGLARSENLEPH